MAAYVLAFAKGAGSRAWVLASASTFHYNSSSQQTTAWLLVAWEFRVITVFYSRLGL